MEQALADPDSLADRFGPDDDAEMRRRLPRLWALFGSGDQTVLR
ncbi:hypothetical protein [Dactylosporangium sp. NPDC048998]